MIKPLAVLGAGALLLASQAAWADARVAVAHFASFADTRDGTAVDILVNGDTFLEGVKFGDFTAEYTALPAGTYTIDIVPAGASEAALTGDFTLEDGISYTVYAQGNGVTQDLELAALVDDVDMPTEGNLNIRIVHAAPFASDLAATEVSIRTADGVVVNELVGVPYGANSGFFQIPAGSYDLKVASNDGSVNYIDILPAELPAGADVTVFAAGDGSNLDLAVFAFPVGELATRAPVDNRSNGMWEVLEGDGVGFILQPMPSQNRLVGTWYQYDEMGNPTFFTFDSCVAVTNDAGENECSTPGAFDGVMATTALTLTTGGGTGEGTEAERQQIGEIDFEILGCNDAVATVRLDGEDPVMYTASQLTRPFPCTDEI